MNSIRERVREPKAKPEAFPFSIFIKGVCIGFLFMLVRCFVDRFGSLDRPRKTIHVNTRRTKKKSNK